MKNLLVFYTRVVRGLSGGAGIWTRNRPTFGLSPTVRPGEIVLNFPTGRVPPGGHFICLPRDESYFSHRLFKAERPPLRGGLDVTYFTLFRPQGCKSVKYVH